MPPAHVTPALPSGKQMVDLDLPAAVVEQVETMACQVLQRSLAPIIQRRRGRVARQKLLHHLLDTAYSFADLEAAVAHALTFTSALGQCLPGLDEEELARILKYRAAAAAAGDSTSKLLSGALSAELPTSSTTTGGSHEADADDGLASETRERSQTRPPVLDELDVGEADHGGIQSAHDGAAPTAVKPPLSMSPEKANPSVTSPQPHRPTGAVVDTAALAHVREALQRLVKERATFTAYLDGEKIQWAQEPAEQVLVLVTGTVLRAAPHPPVAEKTHTAATTAARSRLASLPFSPMSGVGPTAGRRESGRLGGTGSGLLSGSTAAGEGTRRPSSALDAQVRMMGAAAVAGGSETDGTGHVRRMSTVLQGIAAAVAESKLGDVCEETLEAPLVLGEAACLGGFPCCADLVVNAPVAIVAVIPKADYAALVERAPRTVQQQLLSLALQERERLLPYYAPMTVARLRLCPLLQNLKKDQLESLLDYVQPRVFPANSVCSERSEPQHIFFIRRGTVRMERENGEPATLSAQNYLQTPRSRALLVEGHSYGEASCIFRESLGGTFFAISHVDAYLLPFAALIHLMKQAPDAQTAVYDAARLLTATREREVPGCLFRPPDGAVAEGTLPGLAGLIAASSGLFRRSTTATQRLGAAHAQQQALLQHSASLSVSGLGDNRRVSFAVSPADPSRPSLSAEARLQDHQHNSTSLSNISLDAPGGSGGGGAGGLDSLNTTDHKGAMGSAAMVEMMKHIPLLNAIGTSPFFAELAQCWRLRRVEKGDYVLRRGEECNRMILFCQGRAAAIVNEQRFEKDLRCSPFGIPDVDCLSASALAFVPIGFAAGYTCTRRHRWARTVVALDDNVEVLEVTRAVLVQLLQRHNLERALGAAALQIMQPFACVFDPTGPHNVTRRASSANTSRPTSSSTRGPALPSSRQNSVFLSANNNNNMTTSEMNCPRAMVLDYQPLLRPCPNSLWSCHPVPNLHPVVTSDYVGAVRERVLFPLWKDGDFPLPRVSTTHGGGEDRAFYSGGESGMASGSRPLSRRATRTNFHTMSSEASPASTPGLEAAGRTRRLNSAVVDAAGLGVVGSGASSPASASALARAEFQRRVGQEVM